MSKADSAAILRAIETIKAYLRDEMIVSECRDRPCFACASCEAIAMERRLDGLAAIVAEDEI